ncbi:MAG: LysR family transcriptional regulator [Mogibacterium sp.]|nr:LysR family transcriptional regulator [Mogibacterium sp.]
MLFGISGDYNSGIMNIQNLKYFAIVAKLENVSRAAELMHTSQSSISKNIFTLEEELGTKLFDRHGKKLVLNDAGKRFLQSCDRILQETETVAKDLRHMSTGDDNLIRICAEGLDPHLFTFMSMFRVSYPEVEYAVDSIPDGDELPDINRYDLIIYPDELKYRKFKGIDFYTEKYLFAVRNDNPLSERVSLPVKMMNGLPMVFLNHKLVYEYPYHVCLAQTVKMSSVNFVDSRDLHRQMISNGIACGFVPEGSAEIYRNDSRIKLLHLTDDRFSRQMKVCFKREKHLSALGAAFRKAMTDYFNLKDE